MQLTEAQRTQFREEGYIVVHHFFTGREIAAMRAELERFKRDGLLRNVATDGDGTTHSKTVANLQICPITPQSDFYRALPFHPQVVAVVRQLIGDPVRHHLDQIFLKPGGHGMGTSWHQDNAYFKISDPSKGTGMWVALHDATVANGTMHIVPRAFQQPIEHRRDGASDHHIRCSADESKAIPIEMEAGGALFFNYGVPHCTKANTTSHERAGLALHFLRVDYQRADQQYVGPILTGPEATGGMREFGVKVEGTWEQQVERLLESAAVAAR